MTGAGIILLTGEDSTDSGTIQPTRAESSNDPFEPGTAPATPSTPSTTSTTINEAASPGGFSGEWVAVFISYFREDQAIGYLPSAPPGSQVLHTDDYTSLRPGYFAVYLAGGFATGREAADYCISIGRASSQDCYGRFLTTDAGAEWDDRRFKVDP